MVRLDIEQAVLHVDNNTVELTPMQCRGLRALCSRPGRWVRHSTLATVLWGDRESPYMHQICDLMHRLRARMVAAGVARDRARRMVQCRRGIGYRISASEDVRIWPCSLDSVVV